MSHSPCPLCPFFHREPCYLAICSQISPSGWGQGKGCPVGLCYCGSSFCSLCCSSFKQIPQDTCNLDLVLGGSKVLSLYTFPRQNKTSRPVVMPASPSRILRAEFTAFMASSFPICHRKAHLLPYSFSRLCYFQRSL